MDSLFSDAICQAAIEILGEKEAFATLKEMDLTALTPAEASRFSLEEMGLIFARKYNSQTAMGLLIRIGRASLIFLRRYFPDISELGGIDNRLKPLDKRFPASLAVLAECVSAELDQPVTVTGVDGLSYTWQIQTQTPIIYSAYYHFGLLEEFCGWLDSRKDYQLVYAADESTSYSADLHIHIREKE